MSFLVTIPMKTPESSVTGMKFWVFADSYSSMIPALTRTGR